MSDHIKRYFFAPAMRDVDNLFASEGLDIEVDLYGGEVRFGDKLFTLDSFIRVAILALDAHTKWCECNNSYVSPMGALLRKERGPRLVHGVHHNRWETDE